MSQKTYHFIVPSYIDCTRCGLCKIRRKIVFGRGVPPADILFIGEAPGKTEDLLGLAFVGLAGRLLNQAIIKAMQFAAIDIVNASEKKPAPMYLTQEDERTDMAQFIQNCNEIIKILEKVTYYITNVVACRPSDTPDGENRKPTPEESWACFDRLNQTYIKCNPKKIVFLGDIAKKHCLKGWPEAKCLVHPAYINYHGGVSSPEFVAFARDLSDVFKELYNAEASTSTVSSPDSIRGTSRKWSINTSS